MLKLLNKELHNFYQLLHNIFEYRNQQGEVRGNCTTVIRNE